MGDSANAANCTKMDKAKAFSRQASKKVVKVSKKASVKGVDYTKTSINSIASALPDSEIMIVAIISVTLFIRAEEAHLKGKDMNSTVINAFKSSNGLSLLLSHTLSLFLLRLLNDRNAVQPNDKNLYIFQPRKIFICIRHSINYLKVD